MLLKQDYPYHQLIGVDSVQNHLHDEHQASLSGLEPTNAAPE